jgi:hypothetical protein
MSEAPLTNAINISFCTTCCNRFTQFAKTFDRNASTLQSHIDVEWVILDFNSSDGLDSFMAEQLPRLSSRIVYAREASGRSWHASVAKNIAHRLGRGNVLFNLDSDNHIGDAVEVVRHYFSQGCRVLHQWSGAFPDGTYGRIAMARDAFHNLGGYDESFYPMGYQDCDILARASAAGFAIISATCPAMFAIKNSKEDSVKNCSRGGMTWRDYNDWNRARSESNIASGILVANKGSIASNTLKCLTGLRPAHSCL